jgi:hypothetical protein
MISAGPFGKGISGLQQQQPFIMGVKPHQADESGMGSTL